MLHRKHILLAVTGGIAAYKSAFLVRLLIKEGAEVKVVMTRAAEDFVTAKTLSVLSKHEVLTGFFDTDNNWNNHVHLAEWADLLIVAPATANTLSKFAHGLCDNIVAACYLSARSPVFIAPAMDLDMYHHPATRQNLDTLASRGNIMIPAETGELASGLHGEGRMAEPEHIVAFVKKHLQLQLPLAGKKVLVNAGPTQEAIDPVRYIGNRSTGKMGIALADAFCSMGAEVVLVLGPSVYRPAQASVKVYHVQSTEEMLRECLAHFSDCDIAVLSAAVADYRPREVSGTKIKKKEDHLHLDLVKTPDILKTLGEQKTRQVLVGFALETENLLAYAKEKLAAKHLDFIVANSAATKNTGFGSDTNQVTIIDKHNNLHNFELKSKEKVAEDIVNFTIQYMHERS